MSLSYQMYSVHPSYTNTKLSLASCMSPDRQLHATVWSSSKLDFSPFIHLRNRASVETSNANSLMDYFCREGKLKLTLQAESRKCEFMRYKSWRS